MIGRIGTGIGVSIIIRDHLSVHGSKTSSCFNKLEVQLWKYYLYLSV